MIFYQTVINKKYSQKIQLVRGQSSGNEHTVINGIGVVNCCSFHPQIQQFWVLDDRIDDPESDEKSQIEHVKEMIVALVKNKKIAFKTVLMDSWSSSQKLMALIDHLENFSYGQFKKNR